MKIVDTTERNLSISLHFQQQKFRNLCFLFFVLKSFQQQEYPILYDKKFCIDGQNAFDIKKKKTGKCSENAVFTKLQIAGKYTQLEVQ
jgi:hypothetical protein